MFCVEPLLLAGYLFTVQPNRTHVTDADGGVVQVQSCAQGLGLHAKAATAGLYAGGIHYGFTGRVGDWSATVQPFVGVSYADHPVRELPQRTQFECGATVLLGYGQARVAVEYWHLSNAGMARPNIGLDLVAVSGGWVF